MMRLFTPSLTKRFVLEGFTVTALNPAVPSVTRLETAPEDTTIFFTASVVTDSPVAEATKYRFVPAGSNPTLPGWISPVAAAGVMSAPVAVVYFQIAPVPVLET